MFRVIKYLFYIAIIALIIVAAYAYLGPLFGVDLSPEQTQIRIPVTLESAPTLQSSD